jgi:SAM-dependent methyltransferase
MKRKPELLETKNRLESTWYDDEARDLLSRKENLQSLLPLDDDFEKWFASFYDNPDESQRFDRDYVFFNTFGDIRGLRILELGFGNGCLSRFLIRRGGDVCSIDLSMEYCHILAGSEAASMPLRSCAEILPFKNESFDIVTAFVALHHFNLEMSFSEIKRVLKPGGRGIFMEPLLNSKMLYMLRQLIPIKDNESPGGGGMKLAELQELFGKYEFSSVIGEFEFITRLERLGVLSKLQRAFRKVDYFLLAGIPFLRKFARTAVIEISKK